jgi:hypothetical protein
MKISDFDHVSTDQARALRDACKRLCETYASVGNVEMAAAQWSMWQAYKSVVEYREAIGCK